MAQSLIDDALLEKTQLSAVLGLLLSRSEQAAVQVGMPPFDLLCDLAPVGGSPEMADADKHTPDQGKEAKRRQGECHAPPCLGLQDNYTEPNEGDHSPT